MMLEEALVPDQPLDDALRVVEAVDAEDDDLDAEGVAETRRLGDDGGIARTRPEAGVVDADRERGRGHVPPGKHDPRRRLADREAEELTHAREEVRGVLLGLEADQIGAEEPCEEL